MSKAIVIIPATGILLLALSATAFAQNAGSSSPDGCQSRKYDLSKPRDFLINLYCIAKQNRRDLWSDQLSKERQARGSEYLYQHFAAWSQAIIEFVEKNLGGDVSKIETDRIKPEEGRRYVIHIRNPTAKGDEGKFAAFMKVIMEGGRLRIDEN